MNGHRVLVTGATGFVGRHALAPLASRGFEIHGATIDAPVAGSEGVTWHPADLLEPGAAEHLCSVVRPTHLLHLAWYAVPGRFWEAPENFRWVEASLALLRAFAGVGGERVVTAGTCAEYDWSAGGVCREGETPLAPATPYGACKDALRRMQESMASACKLSQAWGRLFFPYGPHEHPDRVAAYVARTVLRGQRARCTSGEQVRDFIFVEEAGAAFAALLDSEVQGPVNVASGRAEPLADLLRRIATLAGHPELLILGAMPDRPGDPPVLAADVARLRHEVGFPPGEGPKDAAEKTLAFWRPQS